MKQKDRPSLPACPLSSQCLRMLDDLDTPAEGQSPGTPPLLDDLEDERLLARLRTHVPTCQTCSTLLREARRERARQRTLLRDLLAENERRVPSMAEAIMARVRDEQASGTKGGTADSHDRRNHHQETDPALIVGLAPGQRKRTGFLGAPRRPRALYEALALVAAVVLVLVSMGVFGSFLLRHSNTATSTTPTRARPSPVTYAATWNSVVVVQPLNDGSGREQVYNYDPFSGAKQPLSVSCCDANSALDSIAHSGRDLLYHVSTGGQTAYHTLTSSVPIYACQCDATTSAIWESSDQRVFIDTTQQIVAVDAHGQGKSQPIAAAISLQATTLVFFHNSFLYFERAENAKKVLYRLDLASGQTRMIAERTLYETFAPSNDLASAGDDWLLSPDGSTIYFAEGTGDAPAIFAVNSDGSHLRALHREGLPLGFAANNALIFLKKTNAAFQVMELGQPPLQDRQLLANAAPGAQYLMARSVALSPYGYSLVVQALYPDKSLQVWSSNLVNGQQHRLLRISDSGQAVRLVGWDQMPVRSQSRPGSATPAPSATSTPAPSWNGIALVSSTASALTLTNYNYLNGHSAQINTGALPTNAQVDGIAPDGLKLAYHISRGGITSYYTVSLGAAPQVNNYFNFTGAGGNAIWMNMHDVLVNTPSGIVEVDTQTHAQTLLMNAIQTPRIVFFHDPYLYFIGGADRVADALYRIQLGSGTVQQVTQPSPNTTFWLSPDGRTVYYVNRGQGGSPGIYAVDSDGMNLHLLRSDGVPIGYAPDNSLIIMRQADGLFQVVQLGLTPAQDQVLLDNAAPGAVSLCGTTASSNTASICDSDVALAPYAHTLAVQAYYADGSHKVLVYDLLNHTSGVLLSAPGSQQVRLIGWDQSPPQ